MSNLSLGTIEVFGLPAAVEAADVACKTADVQLIGYETTDGMGMVAVKIEGQVSAVQSAVAAASAAAARITKVFATSVIARPSEQLEPIVMTEGTVGLAKPKPAPVVETIEPTPEPAPSPELSEPQAALATSDSDKSEIVVAAEPPVEPVETTTPITHKTRVARRPASAKSESTKK